MAKLLLLLLPDTETPTTLQTAIAKEKSAAMAGLLAAAQHQPFAAVVQNFVAAHREVFAPLWLEEVRSAVTAHQPSVFFFPAAWLLASSGAPGTLCLLLKQGLVNLRLAKNDAERLQAVLGLTALFKNLAGFGNDAISSSFVQSVLSELPALLARPVDENSPDSVLAHASLVSLLTCVLEHLRLAPLAAFSDDGQPFQGRVASRGLANCCVDPAAFVVEAKEDWGEDDWEEAKPAEKPEKVEAKPEKVETKGMEKPEAKPEKAEKVKSAAKERRPRVKPARVVNTGFSDDEAPSAKPTRRRGKKNALLANFVAEDNRAASETPSPTPETMPEAVPETLPEAAKQAEVAPSVPQAAAPLKVTVVGEDDWGEDWEAPAKPATPATGEVEWAVEEEGLKAERWSEDEEWVTVEKGGSKNGGDWGDEDWDVEGEVAENPVEKKEEKPAEKEEEAVKEEKPVEEEKVEEKPAEKEEKVEEKPEEVKREEKKEEEKPEEEKEENPEEMKEEVKKEEKPVEEKGEEKKEEKEEKKEEEKPEEMKEEVKKMEENEEANEEEKPSEGVKEEKEEKSEEEEKEETTVEKPVEKKEEVVEERKEEEVKEEKEEEKPEEEVREEKPENVEEKKEETTAEKQEEKKEEKEGEKPEEKEEELEDVEEKKEETTIEKPVEEKEEVEEEKEEMKKEEKPEEKPEKEEKEEEKEEEKPEDTPVVEMKEEKPAEEKEKEENTVEKEQKPEEKEEKPEEKPEEEKEEVKKVVEEEKKEEPTIEMPKEKPSRKPAEKKERAKKPKSPKKSPMEEEEPVRATFTDPLRAADFPPTPVSIAHASPLLAPVLRSLLAAIDANHAWQETRALLDVASQLFDHHVAVMALLASHVLAVAATRPLSDPENAVQCLVLITAGNLPLTRSVSDRCVKAAQEAAAKKDAVCFAQATAVLVAFFAAWREDCFVADLAAVFLAAFAKEAVVQPLPADTAPLIAAALEKYAEVLELLPTPLGTALVGATGLNAVMAVGRALSALPALPPLSAVPALPALPAVADRELTVVVRVMAGVYRHAAKKEALVEVMVRVCAAVGQLQEASEAMVLVKAMVLELATAHGKEMKAVLQDLRRSDVRVVQSVLRKAIEEKGEGKKKRRASHVPIRLDESKFMWRVCSTRRAVTTPVLGERRLVLADRLPRLLLLGVQLLQEVRVHVLVDHVLHAPALLVLVRVHRSTLHTLALTSRLVWNVEAKADGEHGEHVAAVLQLVDELHLVVPVVDEVLAVHRAARRAAHHHVRLHDRERHAGQRLHRLLLRPPRLVHEALYVRHRVCHYVCRQPRIGDLTYFAMHAVQKVCFGGRQILLQLLEAIRLRLADLAHLRGELEGRQHEGDAVGVGSGGVDAEQTLVQLDCV